MPRCLNTHSHWWHVIQTPCFYVNNYHNSLKSPRNLMNKNQRRVIKKDIKYEITPWQLLYISWCIGSSQIISHIAVADRWCHAGHTDIHGNSVEASYMTLQLNMSLECFPPYIFWHICKNKASGRCSNLWIRVWRNISSYLKESIFAKYLWKTSWVCIHLCCCSRKTVKYLDEYAAEWRRWDVLTASTFYSTIVIWCQQ